MSFLTKMLFGSKKKAPTSPLLGSTAAQLEAAKKSAGFGNAGIIPRRGRPADRFSIYYH